tara:strand:- start:194 stop:493 length:300 start_codon:yes stop_codon:yes gene_type:complete
MIIGTARLQEAASKGSEEGYHSFHTSEGEKYGSFLVQWLEECDTEYEDFEEVRTTGAGWYWIACFMGCLPDGDFPIGPFASSSLALYDADEWHPDNEEL